MNYFIMIFLFIFAGCENGTVNLNGIEQSSDSDMEEQTNDDEYDLESDDPYIDKKNGIQWSETVFENIFVNDAIIKCESLVEKGLDGFYLPTIEQLQTLIKNCSNAEGCEEAEDCSYSVFGDTGRFWSASQEYVGDIAVVKSPYPVPLYLDYNVGLKGYDLLSEKNLYQARCARENLFPGSVRKDQPCEYLPGNAKWNTTEKINQTWNGEEWQPSLESEYNEEPSTEECRYTCEEGYVGKDRACVAPEIAEKWSDSSNEEMTVFEAIKYCENLEENGKNDWKLPTVSQIRELVVNCEGSQVDGECRVTDECLDKSECWDEKCGGCSEVGNYKKYSVFWDEKTYLTYSPNTETWEDDCDMENNLEYCSNDVWTIDFIYGRIMPEMSNNKHYVRCVREM